MLRSIATKHLPSTLEKDSHLHCLHRAQARVHRTQCGARVAESTLPAPALYRPQGQVSEANVLRVPNRVVSNRGS